MLIQVKVPIEGVCKFINEFRNLWEEFDILNTFRGSFIRLEFQFGMNNSQKYVIESITNTLRSIPFYSFPLISIDCETLCWVSLNLNQLKICSLSPSNSNLSKPQFWWSIFLIRVWAILMMLLLFSILFEYLIQSVRSRTLLIDNIIIMKRKTRTLKFHFRNLFSYLNSEFSNYTVSHNLFPIGTHAQNTF